MTWRRIVLLAVMVGILLLVPSLWLGFVLSDLGILPVLERWYPETGQPFNVYASFFDLPGYPWWIDSETRLEFCRPLASALLHLDHWLYGRNAVGYHLHSLLWLGGLIAACGLLYSRLPRSLGALALVLLAFDECHFISSGWICGRHALTLKWSPVSW